MDPYYKRLLILLMALKELYKKLIDNKIEVLYDDAELPLSCLEIINEFKYYVIEETIQEI